jgi:hypothetical protein
MDNATIIIIILVVYFFLKSTRRSKCMCKKENFSTKKIWNLVKSDINKCNEVRKMCLEKTGFKKSMEDKWNNCNPSKKEVLEDEFNYDNHCEFRNKDPKKPLFKKDINYEIDKFEKCLVKEGCFIEYRPDEYVKKGKSRAKSCIERTIDRTETLSVCYKDGNDKKFDDEDCKPDEDGENRKLLFRALIDTDKRRVSKENAKYFCELYDIKDLGLSPRTKKTGRLTTNLDNLNEKQLRKCQKVSLKGCLDLAIMRNKRDELKK